jgi:hypothetical protein
MRTGHCLCGAVRFAYDGPETWRAHCHCESCRRQTASPFTTFMGVPDGAWRWTGVAPAVYASSPGVRRMFCPTCGAPVAYAATAFRARSTSTPRLLDDAAAFEPQAHVHWNERLPWMHLSDDLPKGLSARGAGGPGSRPGRGGSIRADVSRARPTSSRT